MHESRIGIAPQEEKLHPKLSETLFVAPPISANALLNRIIPEPPELPLAESLIHFYKFKTKKATEYTGIADSPFYSRAEKYIRSNAQVLEVKT